MFFAVKDIQQNCIFNERRVNIYLLRYADIFSNLAPFIINTSYLCRKSWKKYSEQSRF